MFIQIEETPNPKSLKFLPGVEILTDSTSLHLTKKDENKSNLAKKLFSIDEVESILLGKDFISISLKNQDDWSYIKPKVLAYIMDFFETNSPILNEVDSQDKAEAESEEDSEIVSLIKELIEERVRPAVAMDGGDIIYHSFIDGVVFVKLQGSCSGCPSSLITLKQGIENMLKYYIPEVKEVQSID